MVKLISATCFICPFLSVPPQSFLCSHIGLRSGDTTNQTTSARTRAFKLTASRCPWTGTVVTKSGECHFLCAATAGAEGDECVICIKQSCSVGGGASVPEDPCQSPTPRLCLLQEPFDPGVLFNLFLPPITSHGARTFNQVRLTAVRPLRRLFCL